MKEFMAANPCPFCGAISEPELGQSFIDSSLYGCFVCEIFTPREVWDNRPVEDKLRERISELELDADAERIRKIDVEYERTRMAQIVTMKERIAELEAENARITELALDQAEQAIKRIGELETALQYERNFPSYVERRKIV